MIEQIRQTDREMRYFMAANGKKAVTLEQLKMYGDSFAPHQ